MKIGILGGSFNPVHIGHTMLASYLAQWTDLDQVWLVLSPLNPLKNAGDLAPDRQRFDMLRLAAEGSDCVVPCDVELSMPVPSYTIDTLQTLRRMYPDDDFCLIVGSDNWAVMDRWRDPQTIIREFGIMIYPRPGYDVDSRSLPPNVELVHAPVCSLSSTMIRDAIASGRDVNYFVHPRVYEYIRQHKLYNFQ